jgi:hypothetical protein
MAFPGIELDNVRVAMKILLFGASGTACLDTPVVEGVRVIVRRPLERTEAKQRVLSHGF